MDNVSGAIETAVSVFGGLNIELSPTDLPQGLSPDCHNVAYLPGSVFTRPSLKRYLSVPDNAQVVYAKDYTKNDGTVVNLKFDSKGRLWADGVQIGATTPGNRIKTVSAFGREYIATSDGLHGADVPLQYDGQYLDRISQDGPGAGCTVNNYALPAVALVTGSAGAAIAVTSAIPVDPQLIQTGSTAPDYSGGYIGYQSPTFETYYTALTVTTAAPHGLVPGTAVTISGNSLYDQTAYVSVVDNPTTFELPFFGQSNAVGSGGSISTSPAILTRSNNIVTAYTASPHKLRTGYRVQISNVPAQLVGNITSLVINNEDQPGVATITTSGAHGLTPGLSLTLTGISPVTVGGGVVTTTRYGNVLTVVTTGSHGLSAGAVVNLSGTGGDHTADGQFSVATVTSPTSFTMGQQGTDGSSSGGTVTLAFPNQTTANPVSYSVTSVPAANQFQVPISYVDGTWTTGSISFPWDGTFYVSSVISDTGFTYSQAGPNATENAGGMVTPQGQIAPGKRSCVVIFQTRTGYLTKPSPVVSYIANGTQYVAVQNVPIGPPNVVARIIAFTPANGGKYFYNPVAPMENGEPIGTATVINDNTTTSAIFDFSDQSLTADYGIDVEGNNLFRQVVLGPCLGLFPYASRLFAWGEYNKIEQFVNMGFEGGFSSTNPTQPLGWTVNGIGALTNRGDYGQAWSVINATISQPAYQDRLGIPILTPQTQYTFRLWASGSGRVTADFYSPTAGVLASASVPVVSGFADAVFSQKTPLLIPPDTVLRVSAGAGCLLDELEVIYTDNPYRKLARGSYVINYESFDSVTCNIGEAGDPHEIVSMFERKDTLHILTSGPNGSLYETQSTSSLEPGNWNVQHVAAKCGGISVWGDAQFEDWQVWASDTGLRIYDGGYVEKMSQEIQPWWDTFNLKARQFTVVANDPYLRRIYVLAPIGNALIPSDTYMLDYRELNTASALSQSGPLKMGYGGKMLTTDLTRKWSPWSITANYCSMMQGAMAFCGGTGTTLTDPSHGGIYTLAEGAFDGLDDDYGAFDSRYTPYFFISQDEAQQRQMGTHRKLFTYLTASISGLGLCQITPLVDDIVNQWRACRPWVLKSQPFHDFEAPLNVSGDRATFRFQSIAGLDGKSGFKLTNLVVAMKDHPFSPVRGNN